MSAAVGTEKMHTATNLATLPDDGYRYELVRGCLIRDQPHGYEHFTIVANVTYRLKAWCDREGRGRVGAGDGGFHLRSNPDTVRAPDVAFLSDARLPEGRLTGYVEGAPDLAVEVMSPRDSMADVLDKVRDYFDAGVGQVWVVVPANRTVMVHRSLQDVVVLKETDTILGDGVLDGLELLVADIFE